MKSFLPCLAMATAIAIAPPSDAAESLETLTVIASREAQSLNDLAASVSVVTHDDIALVSAVHVNESLTRVPGVWVSRGNGQEHLTAIRSPVLTGAGSCGAFAITEDGVAVRATGFCNVNQLFDINTEQAGKIDVLRGPGTVLYGSDAQHGVINVVSLAPASQPETLMGLEAGPDQYGRLTFSHSNRQGEHAYRISTNGAHDGGYKDDSGFGQQKLTARHDWHGGDTQVKTLFSLNNLNQETAGYVVGKDAYKDPARKRENPNPEAFRDVKSARIQSQISFTLDNDSQLLITPYARSNEMQFLMHFLPGTPLEENGHQSVGLQSAWFSSLSDTARMTTGIDLEYTEGWLKQSQAVGFSSFPAGKQYDYTVDGLLAAGFASVDLAFSSATELTTGLRYEWLQYDYHNRMISGDTAEDGSKCVNGFTGAVGCRYTRPEDSVNRFGNLSANLGLLHKFNDQQTLFVRMAQGKRAPQATEMYRLQNGQMQADLDSERILSAEIGLRGQWESLRYSLAAFQMNKTNVMFQNADRLYLAGGETAHQGIEYDLQWILNDTWDLAAAGTFAKHDYRSDVSAPGSNDELQTRGNRIVSAPDQMHSLRLGWHLADKARAELEWLIMGSYYTDLANEHDYEGHNLLTLRTRYQLSDTISVDARLKNLTNTDYAERADYSAFDGDRYFIGEPRALYADLQIRW